MRKVHESLHQYIKVNIAAPQNKKPYFVFKCNIKGCSHYKTPKMLIGTEALCNECEEYMVITKITSKPICEDCSNPISSSQVLEILTRVLNAKPEEIK